MHCYGFLCPDPPLIDMQVSATALVCLCTQLQYAMNNVIIQYVRAEEKMQQIQYSASPSITGVNIYDGVLFSVL